MSPHASGAGRIPRFDAPDAAIRLVKVVLIVAALFAATRVGTRFLMIPYASLAWPPTGVALALYLLLDLRAWPAVLLGTAAAEIVYLDLPPRAWPFVLSASVFYPAVTASILTRYFAFRTSMDRVRDVLALLLVATLVGAGSAVVAIVGPHLVGAGTPISLPVAWATWVAGGVMGTLVFAPLILTWAEDAPFDMRPSRVIEAIAAYTLLGATALADFGGLLSRDGPTSYAIFPFVIWAALRFGPRGAALAHLIAACVAITATAEGVGPFVGTSIFASLLYLHTFTLVMVMTSLLLAAATSERTRARKVAEHNASELEAILSSINDAILVCDRDKRLALSNPAALRLFGHDAPPPTVERAFESLALRDEDGAPVSTGSLLLARSLQGETLHGIHRTFRNPKSGRDVHIDVSAAPIVEAGRIVGAVTVSRDMTEKFEFERMRDDFFSVAAHELKTPLTVQKAAVQSLARLQSWDTPIRLRMEAIERGADRMNRVVEDMLDVSQISVEVLALRLSEVDLSSVVRTFVDNFSRRRPEHPFVLTVEAAIAVEADTPRIELVLRNLLENAAKYSPAGSTVEVEVTANDRFGVVTVRDHGVGIPIDKQARIFERFYRAHQGTALEHRGGLGVGLYVSRSIVERHGGCMTFRSTPGRGSAFSFSLPRASRR